jgi:hypothetical protein
MAHQGHLVQLPLENSHTVDVNDSSTMPRFNKMDI